MKDVKNYHIIIRADRPEFLNFRELWRYRGLAFLLTKRDFSLKYKQTILGPLWLVLNPLITCMIYVFIFSRVAGIGTEGVPPIVFYLAGTGIWNFMASIVNNTSGTFTGNAYIFGKVYFPRLVMPLSYVFTGLIEFVIRFAITVIFSVFFIIKDGFTLNFAGWIFIPVILVWMMLLGLGIGLIICSLTTKYRDLKILAGFGMQLWMYATPVVYPLSTGGDSLLWKIVKCNPAAAPVELFRKSVFGTGDAPFAGIMISLIFTAACLAIGLLLFNRSEKNFMDTV